MARGEDDSYMNGSVHEVFMEEGRKKDKEVVYDHQSDQDVVCGMPVSVSFVRMLLVEFFGTYSVMLVGWGTFTVLQKKGMVTVPVDAVVGGIMMITICTVGHISGPHFIPTVTLRLAVSGRVPWKQVPAYMLVHTVAATIACLMLWLMFGEWHEPVPVTLPGGSNIQSLVIEFIITFYLMFIIMAVAADDREVRQMAGMAVGATILLNVLFPVLVSGASMNPARSIGPALVGSKYRSLWAYILGPFAGAVAGAWAYNLMRHTDKPLHEITKSTSRTSN